MLDRLKKLLENKDDRERSEAEQDFDDLMATLSEDEEDLAKLEKHVRAAFEEMEGELKHIREGVDEVVQDKAA